MPKPLRDTDPSLYRLITIRTLDARLWMIPSRNMEKLIGGILARYIEILGIELYAYCFLSNHFHLLIKAPLSNTDELLENVNREIARRVNWKNHRLGTFWQGPYSDQEVLSEADLTEAFLYITTNAVHHGLVEHPGQWPGLCSYGQSLTERERGFTFYYYSAPEPEQRACHHSLKLSILPQFQELSSQERRKRVSHLIDERTKHLVDQRQLKGGGFLGRAAILEQVPGSLPKEVSRSPRPCAYTKNPALYKEARAKARARRAAFDYSSCRFRMGDLSVKFPEFCFKPPLHRKPRGAPFEILPQDSFKDAA